MIEPPIKKPVTIVSACMRRDGYPDFALNQVEVDEEEFVNGVHFLLVEALLTAAGFEEPFVHFPESDGPVFLIPAVRQYLGLETPDAVLAGDR